MHARLPRLAKKMRNGCAVILPAHGNGNAVPMQKMSYVLSGIAILICGGIGAAIAWTLVLSIGLNGIPGALAATVIGMVLATALFALGVLLGKALGCFK
jgi:ABC-type sulfate transport system permease component